MRSSAVRHVTHLHLTLVGPTPEIRRDVAVDRSLTLAHLHRIVLAVFDRPPCRHHLFTDTLDKPGWSHARRRWGDSWTMIDLRDPNVIDEATARIGSVLHDSHIIYHGHTCEFGWLVEIEAGIDDMVPSSDPPARILDGARRAPLPCCRDPYEHDVLVGVLADSGHPEHGAARACLSSTVGPWARFDPEEFDIDTVQNALDELFVRSEHHDPLPELVALLPTAARAGLRAHLSSTGIGLPSVVTVHEADETVRDFRWLIERAGTTGIPLVDGAPDPSVIEQGTQELGCDADRVLRVISAARRHRLLYARSGRLIAKKSVVAAARRPLDLWALLAEEVACGPAAGSSPTAQALFLLAIADGSLADPAIGVEHAAQALQLAHAREQATWSGCGYDARDGGCDSRCDCSDALGASWHDLVTKAIRDAAASGARDGAVTVASGLDPVDVGLPYEWVGDYFSERATVVTRTRDEVGANLPTDAFVRELGGFVELLSLFGLARTDDGAWLVPPALREFARAGLHSMRGMAQGLSPF